MVSPAAPRFEVMPLVEKHGAIPDGVAEWRLRVPAESARGIYLLQLRVYGPDGELPALTSLGQSRGTLYLEPVRVSRGPDLPREAPVLAPFGPDIYLHAASLDPADGGRLLVRLDWSTHRPLAANYGISIRLLDQDGSILQAFDTQPGYGYMPTSMWRVGELVSDDYLIASPDDGVQRADCRLHVILYQVSTAAVVGEARVGEFALPLEAPFVASSPARSYTLPYVEHSVGVAFGDAIRLAGYDLRQDQQDLSLTLWWQAAQTPSGDYTVFVHLLDELTGQIVAQSDAKPRGGGYPTSWWVGGEVVGDTVNLRLEDLPAGVYRVAVGLYDHTATRLVAIDQKGQRVADDRVVLPSAVEVRR
jgi:hypothetical protein